MSQEAIPDPKLQKMREFMQLLPLTIELAGLPKSPHDRLLNADQIEARVLTLKLAYKQARQLVREVASAD